MRADAPDDAAVAPREEVLGFAVGEEGVHAAAEEQTPLELQRRYPQRVVSMQPEGQVDELLQLPTARDRCDSDAHRRAPYMPTSIDVFAKVRGHDREALLRAAREADLLPYFRTVESPAMPVVEMEGRPRIMLASNNYLGLTADERVMRGAAGRAHPLRHRPHRLAPAQRHDAAAPRARARARRVDGHRGGDRVHAPATRPTSGRSARC